jgi:hypothetical protein
MSEGNNELVESRVDTLTAYLLDIGLRLERDCDAFVQLFFCQGNKL